MIFTTDKCSSIDMSYQRAADHINDGNMLMLNGAVVTAADIYSTARAESLQSIADKHAEMLTLAAGGATAAERDTWIVKEREALAVLAGATTSDALQPVAGETLQELAQKVAQKAVMYRLLVGIADHIKRTAEKGVESLTLESPADLAGIDAVLATAKQAADDALAMANASR